MRRTGITLISLGCDMSVRFETSLTVLPESEWQSRQSAHEARVRHWTDAHQARRSRGEQHPVYDFLFSYYAFRPAWLRRWHPGPDVLLRLETFTADSPALKYLLSSPGYRRTADGLVLDPAALMERRRDFVQWLQDLLIGMRDRPAFFGCFGLHEWAMVYRQTPEQLRHNSHPLRFPPEELAGIVERSAVCCTHFDAFRFFTTPARPLNKTGLTREQVPQQEQRGCLHANMDLYKWAFKLAPSTPSELLADSFELARDIREVDMRASPYDLQALGFAPIAIETAAGRADYERHQREFSARGEPLRERLIGLCARLLSAQPGG